MTELELLDILKQVLEIVDLFEDENKLMTVDTILCNPRLDKRRHTLDDLDELMTADTRAHVAMCEAARMIGDAIRAKFGLPAKEDEAEG